MADEPEAEIVPAAAPTAPEGSSTPVLPDLKPFYMIRRRDGVLDVMTLDHDRDETASELPYNLPGATVVEYVPASRLEAAERERDALFSLLCRRGRNRWWPLVTVWTGAESLPFDGFATREEAMETLVRWGEAGAGRSESEVPDAG